MMTYNDNNDKTTSKLINMPKTVTQLHS